MKLKTDRIGFISASQQLKVLVDSFNCWSINSGRESLLKISDTTKSTTVYLAWLLTFHKRDHYPKIS